MPALSLAEILDALAPGWFVKGASAIVADQVCVDSRLVQPGALFVAMAGDRTDGHEYVSSAVAMGAHVCLVERAIAGVPCVDTLKRIAPPELTRGVCVRVASTLGALQTLAAHRRQRIGGRVIGVTGSVGKTTAKEAVAAVLSARHRVLKSSGNRNNEIGLPLTLMAAEDAYPYIVLEMGMYALGEIADLCRIARPDAGLVTNVEPVHLERLGTIERIARAKAELVESLPAEGWAALNADDRRVVSMAGQTRASIVTFGLQGDADVQAEGVVERGLDGVSLSVRTSGSVPGGPSKRTQRMHTRMLGRAAVRSALAGITVGLMEGLSWDEIQAGLDDLGQGLRLVTRPGRHESTILDDCYNASPTSVSAALQLLRGLKGRRVAVLGDMLELGDQEVEGHRQIGRVAAESCDILLAMGDRAQMIAAAAIQAGLSESRVLRARDTIEAVEHLAKLQQRGDVILVKGSRGMQMERIVTELEEVNE